MYAPVRKSSRRRPKGRFRRKCIEKDPEYNMRNMVESVNHSLKSIITSLRSKKHYMKKREMGWHILIYNLERIEKIIQIIFWLSREPFRT